MLPARLPSSVQFSARQAQREILLWTTKDGREIPLDEMSDDHIANAVRVLTLWRSRLKKRDGGDPVLRELADAIARFKRLQRQRRKTATRLEKPASKKLALRRG